MRVEARRRKRRRLEDGMFEWLIVERLVAGWMVAVLDGDGERGRHGKGAACTRTWKSKWIEKKE